LGAVKRLVQITTDAAIHYFGEHAVTYDGHEYTAYLIADSPVHRYRSLQADVSEIKLANTDGVIEALLGAQRFEGAKCVLLEYFFDLESPEAAELVRGILSEQSAGEDVVSWRLIPEYDFTGIVLPERDFATTCGWRFKSDRCGYQDGVDPDDPDTEEPFIACSKDYAACEARGRVHRFNGFIQITTTLRALYPPLPPTAPPPANYPPGGYGPKP
jgi:lambda family phage minor tail protein L